MNFSMKKKSQLKKTKGTVVIKEKQKDCGNV